MTEYRIMVNPAAGSGAARKIAPNMERIFSNYQANYDIGFTESPWHAACLAQQVVVCGCDIVFSVGGDGTANEVLNGLLIARDYELGEARL